MQAPVLMLLWLPPRVVAVTLLEAALLSRFFDGRREPRVKLVLAMNVVSHLVVNLLTVMRVFDSLPGVWNFRNSG